jgi:hypothetical protein
MEPIFFLLLCTEVPATDLCTEPNESSSYTPYFFDILICEYQVQVNLYENVELLHCTC